MKKLFIAFCICIVTLTGCSSNEKASNNQVGKTILLEDNVLVNQIDYSDKITKEKLDLNLSDDFKFKPGFFFNGSLYGVLSSKDDNYRAFFKKDRGVTRAEVIAPDSSLNYMSKLEARTPSYFNPLKSIYLEDVAEYHHYEFFPYILTNPNNKSFKFAPLDGLNDISDAHFFNIKAKSGESLMPMEEYGVVMGNDNYAFSSFSAQSFKGNPQGILLNSLKVERSYSMMSLYNCDKNELITYDGKLKLDEFPYLTKIMYNDKDKSFYAFGGNSENKLYKIDVKGDKYTIKLIYTFDLSGRTAHWEEPKIINGTVVFTEYTMQEGDKPHITISNPDVVTVFNLTEKKVIGTLDSTMTPVKGSRKYFIINTRSNTNTAPDSYLYRINDNKIECIYKLASYADTAVIDEKEKQLFVTSYINENNSDYYLYNINID